MPSKKQRAKKPGSKVAQQKEAAVAPPSCPEDEAAQWIQRQLKQQQDAALRGRTTPVESRAGGNTSRAGRSQEATQWVEAEPRGGTGRIKQHAAVGNVEVVEDEVHHATKGEMQVHRPIHGSAAHDEMNMHTPPPLESNYDNHDNKREAKSDKKKPTVSSNKPTVSSNKPTMSSNEMDPREVAMSGLLRENGLQKPPKEWENKWAQVLLNEVLQTRAKKVEKARAQREQRRANRKLTYKEVT